MLVISSDISQLQFPFHLDVVFLGSLPSHLLDLLQDLRVVVCGGQCFQAWVLVEEFYNGAIYPIYTVPFLEHVESIRY